MDTHFERLTELQSKLSDLALTAHLAGYHDLSTALSNFRFRIERANNDMQMYFHENAETLEKLLDD